MNSTALSLLAHRFSILFARKLRRQRAFLHALIDRLGLPPYTLFVLSAIATGALAGFAAVAFHNAIEFFRELFFSRSEKYAGFLGGVRLVLLPAVGMLLQSLMMARWPDLAARKGVVEVIKAVALRGGYMPLRVTIFHLLAPAICMGSGGTVGPEGPAAQIGAGVASGFSRTLGLPDPRRRIFTAAGAGAAIAAIFNTPLGGVFFALEVALLNDFHAAAFSAILLASVTASVISRLLLGNAPAFLLGSVEAGSYGLFFLYGVLGLCAGMMAVFFVRYSDWLHHAMGALRQRLPSFVLMGSAGLLVGVCGFFFYDILGIGYAGINRVLSGNQVVWMAAALLLLKFLLVPLTLEAGGFGGTFAPALFMGAMLGFIFASAVDLAAPYTGIAAPANALVLVGMGAMLAALNSVPLTAIMILFEMSLNYSIILPLMLGIVGSTLVTRTAFPESVYARKLRHAGFRVNARPDFSLLQNVCAKEIMQAGGAHVIPEGMPLAEVVRICASSAHEAFYIQNQEGKLSGTISSTALRQMMPEYEGLKDSRLVAQDIAVPHVVTVSENDDLAHVMQLFTASGVDELPVVAAAKARTLVGSIGRQDVIALYHKALQRQDFSGGFARSMRTLRQNQCAEVAPGYALMEAAPPAAFVGRTLSALRLRSQYGLQVIMIRHEHDPAPAEHGAAAFIPAADYEIREHDLLVVFGAHRQLEEFKKI